MIALYVLFIAGLAAAGAIPAGPRVQRRGTGVCSGSDFVPLVGVGGSGTPFCESSWGGSYAPVTAITVWSNSEIITGMQVTYADNTVSNVLGNQAATETSTSVNYGFDDLWTRVSMYGGEGPNSFVQHLFLNTTKGNSLNSGPPITDSRYDQPVGSGILFGIHGSYGNAGQINSLAFLFLDSPIASINIDNVQLPAVGTDDNIAPTTIASGSFTNNSPDPVVYTFQNTLTEAVSYAYTQTYITTFTVMNAINFGFSLKLMAASINAGSTTTYVWTNTDQYADTSTYTETIAVEYQTSITLQPGQVASCTAIAGQGQGMFAYSSTVTITLQNGNVYSFPEDGTLNVNSYSQGQAECS